VYGGSEAAMGSICGIYNLNGNNINPEISASMMNELGIYKSDYTDTWNAGQVFLGCCVQFITPESVYEKLPYQDKVSNITIAADAIIDNRAELFAKLGIGKCNQEITDSFLILKAYQKWGKACPAHLMGDFAFAVWDGKTGELFCAVDHTGNRTFYYYISPKQFAFSTLIKPLFSTGEKEKKYSDQWICDYLSLPAVIHQLDAELTIYKDILLLPAAHALTVSKQGISKEVYWQVEKQKELKLKSDQEYAEAFRHVLKQAINCRIRSIKPVGIMLSGGLDSTSIACLAAQELGKTGKSLQAFSSIPMEGYRNKLSSGKIADETPYIEAVREYSGNLDVTYCRCDGKNSLSDTDRFFLIFEQPYKILENLFWIDGILSRAGERNTGIMLTGGMGNTTISYGIFRQYIISLMRSGKWIRLVKEIRSYSDLKKINPTRIASELIKALLPYELQITWYKLRNSNWDAPLHLSPINPIYADRMGSRERFKSYKYDPFYVKKMDSFQFRKMMLAPAHLSHLAGIYTKIALANNLIIRDPSIDKRVIEFCFSVPEEQYIRNGRERFLLRRAMAGILPDKVRLNYRDRGQQSADFVQRLLPLEQEIREEIMRIGQNEQEKKYLDIERIHRTIKAIDLAGADAFNDYNLRMLLRSIIFCRYLKYMQC
jgi:asparagine synthase (glutamine-hydrolysing)